MRAALQLMVDVVLEACRARKLSYNLTERHQKFRTI
jgi:hypothetical protein